MNLSVVDDFFHFVELDAIVSFQHEELSAIASFRMRVKLELLLLQFCDDGDLVVQRCAFDFCLCFVVAVANDSHERFFRQLQGVEQLIGDFVVGVDYDRLHFARLFDAQRLLLLFWRLLLF